MFTEVILAVLIILFVMMGVGFPIYVALLAATIYLQLFVNHMPLQNMFSGIFEAMNKNSLMALPYFIVAGNMIAESSLGERLITVFTVFVRNIRGGLAISCILSNAVFGAISGSPAAATATFANIIYKPLKDTYNEKLSLGILTSAGALSSIIPPSMVMIIYGICTETSIGHLFTAGILPGILLVILSCIYLVIVCKEKPGSIYIKTKGEKITALRRSMPILIMPVFVLGGIYGGFFTPTEAGAFSAVYAFFISAFILKDINMKQFLKIMKTSAKVLCQVFILIAVSSAFGQALNITQAPQALAEIFSQFSPWQFLLFLNILLIIIGCFFDPGAAILILAPLFLPAALALSIDPIHLGIIFTINLSIGMFTPPFGMNIFVAQGILDRPLGAIARGVVPFIIIYLIGLLLVTFIPEIALYLL